MTLYVDRLGPNECTTVSISGREVLVSSDEKISSGDVEGARVNVRDSGVYIDGRSEFQTVGLYEIDGRTDGFSKVAEVSGESGEWLAGFDVDWNAGETSQGDFSSDLLVVNVTVGTFAEPGFSSADAYDHLTGQDNRTEREITSSVVSSIADSYCIGDGGSVTVEVSNESICKSTDVSLDITYELTGETETISLTNDFTNTSKLKRLNSKEEKINFTIPDGTSVGEHDILTVSVTSSEAVNQLPTYTFSSFVGASPDNLSLKPIDDILDVCPGTNISPNVVAVNSDTCPSSLSANITNDFNDDVIELDSSSVPSSQGSEGTTSYYTRFSVPNATSSVDDIEYTVNLLMGDDVVDVETFTVDLSSHDIEIENIDSPNRVCTGDEIRLSIDANNSSECGGKAKVLLSNNINDAVLESDLTDLRGESSRTIRLEETIPPSASSEGSIKYTATLFDLEGNQQDQETFTVQVSTTNVSIKDVEIPDVACVGQSIEGSVEVSNSGDCSTEVTLVLEQESINDAQPLETVELRDDSSRTVRFTSQIPIESEQTMEDVFTLSAQVPGSDGNVITDSTKRRINIGSTDIDIVGTTSPPRRCVGSQLYLTFTVTNDGECGGEYRLLASDNVRESQEVINRSEIDSQRRETVTFNTTMPPEAIGVEELEYTYVLQSMVGGTFQDVASGSVSVDVGVSELSFGEVDTPEQQCIGSSVQIGIPITNSGQCDTEYRVNLINTTEGDSEFISQGTITAGNSTTVRVNDELTQSLAEVDSLDYNIELEKRVSEDFDWTIDDEIEKSITILKPNVDISSTNYPVNAMPGNRQFEIELSNNSQCDTSIDVEISGEQKSIDISSDSTITVTDSFTLKSNEMVRDVTVTDKNLDSVVDENSYTITPHKFINIDQKKGVIEIQGGYDDTALYRGRIIATAVEGGENLEPQDGVLDVVAPYTIQGTSTSDSSDRDTINFGILKGLVINISETTSIIVDGEFRGKTKSYKHTTILSSVTGIDDGDGEASIKTSSGPLSSIGGLRKRLGIDASMVSGPVFTIDR